MVPEPFVAILRLNHAPADGQERSRLRSLLQCFGAQLRVSAPLSARQILKQEWPSIQFLDWPDAERSTGFYWILILDNFLTTPAVMTHLADQLPHDAKVVKVIPPASYAGWPFALGWVVDRDSFLSILSAPGAGTLPDVDLGRLLNLRHTDFALETEAIMMLEQRMFEVSPMPFYIQLDIASACNLKCSMCMYHSNTLKGNPLYVKKGELFNINALNKILDEVASFNEENPIVKPSIVTSVRGEFLLHPEAIDWIKTIKSRDIGLVIVTNGMLLSEDVTRLIVEYGVDQITVSLDSMTQEVGDKVRVGYDQATVERNIEHLISTRTAAGAKLPYIGLSYTDLDVNSDEKDAFVEHWLPRVEQITVQNQQYFDEALWGRRYVRKSVDIDEEQRDICIALINTIVVLPDGEIHACSCGDFRQDTYLGNIETTSLRDAFQSRRKHDMIAAHRRRDFSDLRVCEYCETWKGYRSFPATQSREDAICIEQTCGTTIVRKK